MLQGPPSPAEFIPLMGMLTGILSIVIVGFAIVRVAQSPIGQAIARRIHGRAAIEPDVREELYELREHVAALEHRLAESEERFDFTERLIAQRHDSERLPQGPLLDQPH